MVTRPDYVPAPLAQAANNPPYPVTPTSEHPPPLSNTPPATEQDPTEAHQESGPQSETRAHGTDSEWDSSDDDDDASLSGARTHTPPDVPAPLKIKHPQPEDDQAGKKGIPSALRVGPPGGAPRTSQEVDFPSNTQLNGQDETTPPNQSAQSLQSNNPYLRMQAARATEATANTNDDNAGHTVSSSNVDPVELPSQHTPVELMAEMDLNEPKEKKEQSSQLPLISVSEDTSHLDNQKIGGSDNEANTPNGIVQTTTSPPSVQGHGSNQWPQSSFTPPLAPPTVPPPVLAHEQTPWDENDEETRKRIISATSAQVDQADRNRIIEAVKPEPVAEVPPTLPPRRSQEVEQPPPMPPRPVAGPSSHDGESPEAARERQRKEHYQIKHVNWVDSTGTSRRSPILTQNANGPCPLLALVNALVLTTPANEATALFESLRTREQVSLGLLLDAVFDELMSGRRGGGAQELPDVADLYSFLVTLHTGMNVNPRFGKLPPPPNLMDAEPTTALPNPQAHVGPGDFEETREMRLYSTFNIPLTHGWLPPSDSPEYAAFMRAARTYEDAQNIQFREEELVEKLSGPGLSADEQQLLQDVITIKDFFERWPTQLTDHGLNVLVSGLKPGSVSILFRNDHFLTVYKEPRSGRLFTLVTDAGYAGHQEIVWETLVDVNGQGSELYSGDFRVIGPIASQRPGGNREERPIRSLLDVGEDDSNWSTAQGRGSGRNQASQSQQQRPTQAAQNPQALLSAAEQEDHDLALALQLQEEEEDRERRERERQREEELSREYLSNDTRSPRSPTSPPAIPPRRSAAQQRATGVRNSESDPPPPTYEQAAQGQPFNPPHGHPASPNAPIPGPTSPQSGGGRGTFLHQAPGVGRGGRRTSGRPPGVHPNAAVVEDRERCVVM